MTTPPRTVHLSATAVAAFKACPTRFRYGYVEGLRTVKDTESQRVGTNWHRLHEVYRGQPVEGAFEAAVAELNGLYATVPDGFDATAWAVEREMLAACFAGHVWYYGADHVETLGTEIEFKLPLRHPKTGLPLAETDVIRIGKIDQIIRRNGRISIGDYKSTSKPIDADSQFWNHLRLDTQISIYVDAAKEMARSGALAEYGIAPTDEICGAFYDVWAKPKIRPSLLTQANTVAFIESRQYMGAEFQITHEPAENETENGPRLLVNGELCEVERGKKGFAIRETPAMFGARLLADIYTRPEHYFARREIPRTDVDIRRFRGQLYATYQSMKAARDSGHWIENEHQCNATFLCPYINICWHGVDVTQGHTPEGFKRIFTDLTVEGQHQEI